MCGIVAYVGPRDAQGIVLEGLRRLEYRGYDSAGLAVAGPQGIARRRSVGKLENLAALLREQPMAGCLGMGHTRWATHGGVTEANAHPHTDASGRIVIIQNGIVENYLELKEGLLAEGVPFVSQTDTEVIAHLVARHYQRGAGDLATAVRLALGELRGASAVVAMCADEPDRLVAARLGNAGGVVIGVGDGEMFVASDMPAILEHTQRMIFLDSREVATVRREGARVTDLAGREVEKTVTTVQWNPVTVAKDGYKHFMLKEIHEQSRSITDVIRGRVDFDRSEVILPDLEGLRPVIPHLRRLHAVGCGTAWHACLLAKFLIEDLARLPVEVDYGSEFRYRDPLLEPGSVVLVITQSGETVDTLAAMEEARSKGMQSIALVNVIGSQAARLADGVVYLNAGPEIGVASTKAFTSQVVAAYLLAVYLGQARGTLSRERRRELLHDLARLPNLAGEVLANGNDYEGLARKYAAAQDFLYLGRGIHYPIALEGALKLKEISYIHAEGYPAGEMKHGPIALIDEHLPVVTICPRDKVRDKMLDNIAQVRARGGRVIALATAGDSEVAETADDVIWIPETSRYLTPVLAVIPLQLLAYHIAVLRGADVDQPRNLAKS
ncbi:MAG: glutamine--fructose-6-phosphate transaminase (isomerizing), partial [Chloroflexi bacterium]|nr:glutamine--fructose-6-phosphate transaminase (isomerizing) [Chloroflexota bacterium]